MKLKMSENSLFAILLRSPWWISLLIVAVITLLSFALLPEAYVGFGVMGAFPFLVIAVLAARKQCIKLRQKARRGQPLGRGVEQGDLAAQHALLHLVGFLTAEGGVEEGGGHAGLVQGAHLVVHQRDQRGDHDGHALAGLLAGYGRNLVAQAFAAASGHQHQGVVAGHHVLHDGLLGAAEPVVAEDLAKNLLGRQECGAVDAGEAGA